MKKLLEYLHSIPAGNIAKSNSDLESLLFDVWEDIAGKGTDGMKPEKLLGRMEKINWAPPILSFTIERHGGIALGSSRAELQHWEINVETKSANCPTRGYRQVKPRQAKVDVAPLADEISVLIVSRKQDDRLKWRSDGNVEVVIGKIFPDSSASTQTVAGRRKRFREQLSECLHPHGWRVVKSNVYASSGS